MVLKRMMQAHQRKSDEMERLQRGTEQRASSTVSSVKRSRLLSIREKRVKEEDEHAYSEPDARRNRNRVMDEYALQMLTDLTNGERGQKEEGEEHERRRRQRRERERERERDRERESACVPSLGQLAGVQRREEEEKQPMRYRAQQHGGAFDHYGLAVTLEDDGSGGGGNAGIAWEGRGEMQLGKDVLE